ncbi:MAG: ABC transporter ATP-binding protein [Syntrophomonadaceae bacterium]|jgi:energy-coupling factor transporter ATP-binding protein EcfA2
MAEPTVDIQELHFTYSHASAPSLAGINLKVYPGEFITITGPSGCGKSTLALCLAGFIPHAFDGTMKGDILIQGKNTRDFPTGGLSGIVGLVQQDPEAQLCTLTVRDEVAFGSENLCIPAEEIKERVRLALGAVGAWDLLDRKVHTLSGGEKQRVAIASVLAMNPSLLILDEPTANLDPSCTKEVLETLIRLKEKQAAAIIILEHRLERLLPISDRLLIMDKGKIVAESESPLSHQRLVSQWRKTNPSRVGQLPPSSNKMENRSERPLILSVNNLAAGYGERDVISGISFSASSGETIAIMGDNGSGKTTLLQAILGVHKLRQGTISLQGKDITQEKVSRRARQLGFAFQNPHHQIFANTVFEEAELPSRFLSQNTDQEIRDKVDQLLQEFELDPYREKNPFTLSLGEKKRLTLVSVLAYSPAILILDEPLVGQDHDRVDLLRAAIQQHRRRGGITLMVCHEPDLVVSCCQRVLFLSKGKLLVDAEVSEAMMRLAELGLKEYLPSGYDEENGKKKADAP